MDPLCGLFSVPDGPLRIEKVAGSELASIVTLVHLPALHRSLGTFWKGV